MPTTLTHWYLSRECFVTRMTNVQLTKENLFEWAMQMKKEKTATVYVRRTVHVRAFLKWLHQMGYVAVDLRDAVPTIQQPPPAPIQVWTEEEYERLKEWTNTRPSLHVYRWLFILGYRTGMVLTECCHLRWCHVFLNDNGPSHIEVHRKKVKRFGPKSLCQIPILPGTDLHRALLARQAVAHLNYKRYDGINDYVHQDLPGLYARPMPPIQWPINEIVKKCGIERNGRSFKHFRSTFISNLVNSGAQMALISKMTGHQSMQTLLLYLKADKRALQDELSRAFQYGAHNRALAKPQAQTQIQDGPANPGI